MLIDDIGWTYFITGKVKNAKDNIKRHKFSISFSGLLLCC